MQDYAKHNTQIDVIIYNSLEQLYSVKRGKKIQQEKQTEGQSGEGKGDGAWRHAFDFTDMPTCHWISTSHY